MKDEQCFLDLHVYMCCHQVLKGSRDLCFALICAQARFMSFIGFYFSTHQLCTMCF